MDNEINTTSSDPDFYDREQLRLNELADWDRLSRKSAENAGELDALLADMDCADDFHFSDEDYGCTDGPASEDGCNSLAWVIVLAAGIVGIQAFLRWI